MVHVLKNIKCTNPKPLLSHMFMHKPKFIFSQAIPLQVIITLILGNKIIIVLENPHGGVLAMDQRGAGRVEDDHSMGLGRESPWYTEF